MRKHTVQATIAYVESTETRNYNRNCNDKLITKLRLCVYRL